MYSKSSLELLDTVARLGSFTAAATALHKVPSAVSYRVRLVEQELGVVLFRRLARKVELTPAGELFIAEARALLRQMEEISSQTKRVAHGWQNTLKLTLDNVVKLEKLEPLIEAFYQQFSFAELQINMEVFNGSWEAIAEKRADIVIGATAAIPVNGDFSIKEMGMLDWAFVAAQDHPCAMSSQLNAQQVSQYPAICLDDTSRMLPKRHIDCYPDQRRILLPNWHSAIECIKNKVGVGYIPRHIAANFLHDNRFVELPIYDHKPLSRCCMVWRNDSTNKLIDWMVGYLGSSEQLHQDWLS